MLEEGTPTRDSLKIGEEAANRSAPISTLASNLDWSSGQPQHAQEHDGQVARHLCRPDSASRVSGEGISRACRKSASPASSARKSRLSRWPCAWCPRCFTARDIPTPCLSPAPAPRPRQQDDPRRSGQIPRNLVQTQQLHVAHGRRHHARARSRPDWKSFWLPGRPGDVPKKNDPAGRRAAKDGGLSD